MESMESMEPPPIWCPILDSRLELRWKRTDDNCTNYHVHGKDLVKSNLIFVSA